MKNRKEVEVAKDEKAKDEKEKPGLKDVIQAACDAYGILKDYLAGAGIDRESGQVTLVTNGGKKVRWNEGDKVEKLADIAITGINPANAKRKPITGKKKK